MKHFLDFVVRSLVDNPDDVQISEVTHEGQVIYRVGLHPADIGLVIGKGGHTIGSIRSLVNSASRTGENIAVEVVENA
jgi:predicted RNA-binding protein YlqC (UPF0109 family)